MATDDTKPIAAVTDLTAAARLRQLIRIRWAVRGVLTIGVAVSLAANILHADADPISKAISAWPPVALLLAIELISRVPLSKRWLASIRIAATTAIAGIAAWVSYGHMTAVAAHYGERGGTPYLLPLSVDGLVAAASVSLVELASGSASTPTNHRRQHPQPPGSPRARNQIVRYRRPRTGESTDAPHPVNRRPTDPRSPPTDMRRRTRSGAPRMSQPPSPHCADANPPPPQPRSPNRSDDPCGRYYGSSSDSKTHKPTHRGRPTLRSRRA